MVFGFGFEFGLPEFGFKVLGMVLVMIYIGTAILYLRCRKDVYRARRILIIYLIVWMVYAIAPYHIQLRGDADWCP